MSGSKANYPDSHTDFASIEAAVMETDRGRAFLREFSRRNRHADTEVLLTALSRIEKSIEIRQEPSGVDQFRGDLLEMAGAIEKTRLEIFALHPDQTSPGPLNSASGELDSIVIETEAATSNIIAAAEKIQETAFTLREAGDNHTLCDLLDEQATLIYTASSFQDLTAQRTRKVIDALGFLEKRILAMVDIWAFAPKLETYETQATFSSESAPRPNIMSQADVDFVLVEDSHQYKHEQLEAPSDQMILETQSKNPAVSQDVDQIADDVDELLFSRKAALAALAPAAIPTVREALRIVEKRETFEETLKRSKAGITLSAEEAEQALDALKAMSVEERTLLFS
jgi:hypothetical protein